MVWKNQYYEDDILSKAAYRSNLIPIKFLILYFTGKTTLQFFEAQKSSNNQRNTVQKLVISIVQTLRQLF